MCCVLAQIWDFNYTDNTSEFCHDGFYLCAGLDVLRIESRDDFAMSFSLPMNLYIFIEDIGWIKINRERILWLPVESRPRLFKINGNTLALGHALG